MSQNDYVSKETIREVVHSFVPELDDGIQNDLIGMGMVALENILIKEIDIGEAIAELHDLGTQFLAHQDIVGIALVKKKEKHAPCKDTYCDNTACLSHHSRYNNE